MRVTCRPFTGGTRLRKLLSVQLRHHRKLQIDFDISRRRRTTDQDITGGRRRQRIGLILYTASDQCAFAGVADSCTAGPLHGNVARFRKFEQAGKPRIPGNREAASGKRNLRATAGFSRRQVNRRPGRVRDSWRDRFLRAKQFHMYPSGIRSPCPHPLAQLPQE